MLGAISAVMPQSYFAKVSQNRRASRAPLSGPIGRPYIAFCFLCNLEGKPTGNDLIPLFGDTCNSISTASGSRVAIIRILCHETIVSRRGRLTFLLNCEIAVGGLLLFRGYGLSEWFTAEPEARRETEEGSAGVQDPV